MPQRAKTIPALLLQSSADSWGDERERGVMLEAYAYVFILMNILLWTLAAVAAWFVPAWVTIVLFVAMLIPSLEWQRYSRARGVDANMLAYGGESWIGVALTGLYFGACALSMATAVVSQFDNSDSSVSGGIAGGVVGALTAVLVGRWAAKRKQKRDADDLSDQ